MKFLLSAIAAAAIVITGAAYPLGAAPVYVSPAACDGRYIGQNVEYLEDRETKWEMVDILSAPLAKRFKKWDTATPVFGATPSTYWLRFDVHNPAKDDFPWFLEIENTLLDHITVYAPDVNGYKEIDAGDMLPFGRRMMEYRTFIFPFTEKPGQRTYYLRVRDRTVLSVPMRVWSEANVYRHMAVDTIIHGIYIGMLLIMFLYNLFIYFSARDLSFVYLSLTTLFLALWRMSHAGEAFQYLWPETPWLNDSFKIFMMLSGLSFFLFIRSFLETRRLLPVFDKILLVLTAVTGLFTILAFLVPLRTFVVMSLRVMTPIILIYFALSIAASFLVYRKGNRSGLFFLIAFGLQAPFALAGQWALAGIIPLNLVTLHCGKAGTVWLIAILSFGLGDRIRALKDDLSRLNTTLEHKVEERTIDLADANIKLMEMDEQKTNFFANISHEIRTPLTLIMGPVEAALKNGGPNAAEDPLLKSIYNNARTLLALVNDLLDLSRIDSGKHSLRIGGTDISRLLENHIAAMTPSARQKGVSMTFNPVPGLFIPADASMLEKVFMNLLSNALKFTERGGAISVSVETRGAQCAVIVADTGIGIPSYRINGIFDRFGRAHEEDTRYSLGTGIGLALAREIIERHGGAIIVASKSIAEHPGDHGSSFTVLLPLETKHFSGREDVVFVDQHDIEGDVYDEERLTRYRSLEEAIQGCDAPAIPREGSMKILIVEDNVDMRRFLSLILSERYEVHTASNGTVGLEKAALLTPDLIITDIMMPVMNGLEMTKRLKSDQRLGLIPVIMLTARSQVEDLLIGFEKGADDYMTKPFNGKELVARVESLIKTYQFEKIIIERNILMEKELETARQMQQKLLPQTIPAIEGYRYSFTYIPMDKVGGDFYDFTTDGATIELFIADVSGHGLPGAFLSMITKMALSSMPRRDSCGGVMKGLNDILCNATVGSNFVTACYCRLDTAANTMQYANAGHFPPLIYRHSTGEFMELSVTGKLLGIFRGLQFQERSLSLMRGDRILMFTDGIIECIDKNDTPFGVEGLKEYTVKRSGLPPEEFSLELISYLREFAGSEKFDDDVCLIVLDVC